MNRVFGKDYAQAYDRLYADKDYARECDLIEKLFRDHGDGEIHEVLDLGCGTGNHAFPLAQRAYSIVGVDVSPDMLAEADRKRKLSPRRNRLEFQEGDIRHLDLGREFDAVLMMFAVLGYQNSDDDAQAALRTARCHLRTKGLLVFDVWFGPAVVAHKPEPRSKTVSNGSGEIRREASGCLDGERPVCEVTYNLRVTEGTALAAQTRERHFMRYFFPAELDELLQAADFEVLRMADFDDVERVPDEESWNVICVARAT